MFRQRLLATAAALGGLATVVGVGTASATEDPQSDCGDITYSIVINSCNHQTETPVDVPPVVIPPLDPNVPPPGRYTRSSGTVLIPPNVRSGDGAFTVSCDAGDEFVGIRSQEVTGDAAIESVEPYLGMPNSANISFTSGPSGGSISVESLCEDISEPYQAAI